MKDLKMTTVSYHGKDGFVGSPPRIAFLLTHQTFFLPGMRKFVVAHQCDFRICCNPSHLAAGTPGDNSADVVRRGGHWKLRQNFVIYLPTSMPFDLGQFMQRERLRRHEEREREREASLASRNRAQMSLEAVARRLYRSYLGTFTDSFDALPDNAKRGWLAVARTSLARR
jgi:hypothetical protein